MAENELKGWTAQQGRWRGPADADVPEDAETVDDPVEAPKAETTEAATEAAQVAVEEENSEEGEVDTSADANPNVSDPKADWVARAEELGLDVGDKNKDEVVAAVQDATD